MFDRGVSLVPAAEPAGRAEVNWPVAYTRLPTTTWSQTTPLTWTVGSASAAAVGVVSGGTGAVSARAGDASRDAPARARAVQVATANRRWFARECKDIVRLLAL